MRSSPQWSGAGRSSMTRLIQSQELPLLGDGLYRKILPPPPSYRALNNGSGKWSVKNETTPAPPYRHPTTSIYLEPISVFIAVFSIDELLILITAEETTVRIIPQELLWANFSLEAKFKSGA